MEDDSFLHGLPALSELSEDADTRYVELEDILSIFRPHLDDATKRVEAHSFDAMMMAFGFFPQRKASFGMNKEWPFTIDERGRSLVVGGVLDVKAQTPELAEAYRTEFLELVAAKMPEHMQDCRDLEALYRRYEPFAKDMALRYTDIGAIAEDRDHHAAFVAVGKGPFAITLRIDMASKTRKFSCTHGNPADFFGEDFQEEAQRQFKHHNIYTLNHPSGIITSEELLRYATSLMEKRYHSLQDEAQVIKEEMERLDVWPQGLAKDSAN